MSKEHINRRFQIVNPERKSKEVIITSADILEQTKTYEAKGGKINVLPMGLTSEHEAGTPIKLMKDFEKAQERTQNNLRKEKQAMARKNGS